MNKLDVEITKHEGEREALLLIDKKPITHFLSKKNVGMAISRMENGEFPKMSSHFGDLIKGADIEDYNWPDDYRIISVCNCRILGCSHGYCRISVSERSVIFDNFGKDREILKLRLSFEFSKKNYDEVMSRINSA